MDVASPLERTTLQNLSFFYLANKKTNKRYEKIIFRYLYKMKNLALHMNNQLPTQRCEWQGNRMFSTIATPAVFNLGKVDYISTTLREASGW
jgi:hypothetical protein